MPFYTDSFLALLAQHKILVSPTLRQTHEDAIENTKKGLKIYSKNGRDERSLFHFPNMGPSIPILDLPNINEFCSVEAHITNTGFVFEVSTIELPEWETCWIMAYWNQITVLSALGRLCGHGQENNQLYIASTYSGMLNLNVLLAFRQEKFTWSNVLPLFKGIIDELLCLHQAGYLHADLDASQFKVQNFGKANLKVMLVNFFQVVPKFKTITRDNVLTPVLNKTFYNEEIYNVCTIIENLLNYVHRDTDLTEITILENLLHAILDIDQHDDKALEKLQTLINLLQIPYTDISKRHITREKAQSELEMLIQYNLLHSAQILIPELHKRFGASFFDYHFTNKLSPLLLAISKDATPIVYLLLGHGANPNFGNNHTSPLHVAISKRYCASIALLISFGVKIDVFGKWYLLLERNGLDLFSETNIGRGLFDTQLLDLFALAVIQKVQHTINETGYFALTARFFYNIRDANLKKLQALFIQREKPVATFATQIITTIEAWQFDKMDIVWHELKMKLTVDLNQTEETVDGFVLV